MAIKTRIRRSLLNKALLWYCVALVDTCPVHRGAASLERAQRELNRLQAQQHRVHPQTPEWAVPVKPVPPPEETVGGYDVKPADGFETHFLVIEEA